jgi:Ca2+-binding EF-hand superfamily protein
MRQPLRRADVQAMVARHFAMMDLNHDNVIDDADRVAMVAERRAEREARMKAHRDHMFAALDANKDGTISRQEFDAPAPPPPPPPPLSEDRGPSGPGRTGVVGPDAPHEGGWRFGMMGGPLLERADANHDGKVTLAEARKAALAWFDKADVNHDGTIDRDEMIVAMQDRMRGPDGHGRRGRPDGE